MPAPEFFDGVSVALRHNEGGHDAYLLGQVSKRGWWYYFPVTLAVKTPIGFLLLLTVGVFTCWRHREKPAYLPLAFSLGILVSGMAGHVDIGVRHILPVYIGLSILAAWGAARLAERARTGTGTLLLVGLPVIWMAVSGIVQHPDYLAYFNEFAANEPENVLVDSNLDWGQEYKRLAARFRELGVHEARFHIPDGITQFPFLAQWYGLTFDKNINPDILDSGWYVLSPTREKIKPLHGEFDRLKPTERVGALLLYFIPSGYKSEEEQMKERVLGTLKRRPLRHTPGISVPFRALPVLVPPALPNRAGRPGRIPALQGVSP